MLIISVTAASYSAPDTNMLSTPPVGSCWVVAGVVVGVAVGAAGVAAAGGAAGVVVVAVAEPIP